MNKLKTLLRKASLSQKLIAAFVILVTIPVVFNGVLMYQKTQYVLGQQSIQSAQAAMSYFQEKIEDYLEKMEYAFVDIYNYEPIFLRLSEAQNASIPSPTVEAETLINDQLKLYQGNNEEFEQVYLISTGGHVFSSSYHSKNYEMIQSLLHDQALMARIEENGGKSVMLVLSDETSQKLCIAKTIKNVYGNFKTIGTAVVLLKDRNMPELLDSYPYSEDLTLYIVNPYLQVTFQKNVTPFLEQNLEQRDLYSQLPGNSGSADLKIGGRNYWTFYDTGNYSDWKYIEMWDEQKLLSQVIEIKDYFLFVVLLSLLFFWLVIFLTARSISRPIQTLVRSMERVKAGDLNSPVAVSSEGEIGVLSRTFNEMQEEIKVLIGNIQSISNREKEMEINYLKTQINPHFLYNVLGSVNWMAAQKNEPEICGAITDLSDLLRYCLDKNTGDIVTVQEDVAWLEKYVALQRMRYTNGFHVIINADPMVQGKRIHKLMLQPLLENSLMHGGCGAAADALIVIFIQGKPEGIYFEISDNGTGMTPEQAEAVLAGGSGMGIKNVNERLKLYYGEEYGLKIDTSPGQGATVSFTMPYLD